MHLPTAPGLATTVHSRVNPFGQLGDVHRVVLQAIAATRNYRSRRQECNNVALSLSICF